MDPNKIFTILSLLHMVSAKMQIVDLSYTYDNETVYWPSIRAQHSFNRTIISGSAELEVGVFSTVEHGGTHVDAPRHLNGRHGVHEIPLERLVGRLFLVDVSNEASKEEDFLITQKLIERAEMNQNRTINDSIVLFYTGWSQRWPDLKGYLGTDSFNDTLLHFPGLHPNATRWMVNNRKFKSIGIDTASFDIGQDSFLSSHRILFEHNIPAFENVNLKEVDKIKNVKNVMIYALPMKIRDGSGAPTRIIATFDDDYKTPCSSDAAQIKLGLSLMYLFVFVNYFLN
ncbi:kynurenine formamidase-like isoform X2 [Hydractinia symbiolongicarpus]|nr:kynurenine formamidase-like isoform X2 [Hydractinia symbiolongicarpus]